MLFSGEFVVTHSVCVEGGGGWANSQMRQQPTRSIRKHRALHPQKPLRLIEDGEVGGSGLFISNTY